MNCKKSGELIETLSSTRLLTAVVVANRGNRDRNNRETSESRQRRNDIYGYHGCIFRVSKYVTPLFRDTLCYD